MTPNEKYQRIAKQAGRKYGPSVSVATEIIEAAQAEIRAVQQARKNEVYLSGRPANVR